MWPSSRMRIPRVRHAARPVAIRDPIPAIPMTSVSVRPTELRLRTGVHTQPPLQFEQAYDTALRNETRP